MKTQIKSRIESQKTLSMISILLITIGFVFSVAGLVLYYKQKKEKTEQVNTLRFLGVEARLSSASLVIFVVGAGLIVAGAKVVNVAGAETVANNATATTTAPQVSALTVSDTELAVIKQRIERYYTLCGSQNYNALRELYAPRIDRFYDKFGLSPDEVIKNHYDDTKNSGITGAKYLIDWPSLGVERGADGYYVNFNMVYDVIRTQKEKANHFNLKILMTFNNEHKIISMYEQIRTKQ